MEWYFPPGQTNLVLFLLEHISYQELLDKMLKDHDEVAVLSVVSCFMWRSSTHIQNSTLPQHLWEKLMNFSRGRVCKTANWPRGNSERPVHNFSGNQILTFSFSIKNNGRSFCIQCSVNSKDSPLSCSSVSELKELGLIHTGDRTFLEFPHFQKKGQPREVNRNFSKRISGKFLFHSILNRKFWSNGMRP